MADPIGRYFVLPIVNSNYETELKFNYEKDLRVSFERLGFEVQETALNLIDYAAIYRRVFDWVRTVQANENDVVVLYYSGHGAELPEDHYVLGTNKDKLTRQGCMLKALKALLWTKVPKAKEVYIILDCCRAPVTPVDLKEDKSCSGRVPGLSLPDVPMYTFFTCEKGEKSIRSNGRSLFVEAMSLVINDIAPSAPDSKIPGRFGIDFLLLVAERLWHCCRDVGQTQLAEICNDASKYSQRQRRVTIETSSSRPPRGVTRDPSFSSPPHYS